MTTDATEVGSKNTLERKADQLSEIKGALLGKLDEPMASHTRENFLSFLSPKKSE